MAPSSGGQPRHSGMWNGFGSGSTDTGDVRHIMLLTDAWPDARGEEENTLQI